MNKKFDAEPILRKLAEMRKSIPHLDDVPSRRPSTEGRVDAMTAEEFEYTAVADALESLAADVQSAVDRAYASATEKALEVYYTAEALSHDPAHADLIPHVEAMRRAYEKSYGKPIPPKK